MPQSPRHPGQVRRTEPDADLRRLRRSIQSAQAELDALGSLSAVDATGTSAEVVLGDGSIGAVPAHVHATAPYVAANEYGSPVRSVGASVTTEETLFSLSMPAGAAMVVVEFGGMLVNVDGVSLTSTLRINVDGTDLFEATSDVADLPTAAAGYPLSGRLIVTQGDDDQEQRIHGMIVIGEAAAASTGFGGWPESHRSIAVRSALGTADWTAALTLAVTHQWGGTPTADTYVDLDYATMIAYPPA